MARIDLNSHTNVAANRSTWSDRLGHLMSRDFKLGGSGLDNAFKERFYSDLNVLVSSGMDLRSSLDLLGNEIKSGKDSGVIQSVREGVFTGRSLGDVLEGISGFSNYEIHSVRIGEETGSMAEILENLASDFRNRIRIRRELITAFSYPIMVSVIAILAVSFMMTFVVPLFGDLFSRMGQELPWLTQRVIALSDFISTYWWLFVLFFLGLGLSILWIRQNPNARSKAENLLIQFPGVGRVYQESVLARFTGSMSFMLRSHVSLLRSLQLSSDMTGCGPLRDAVQEIETGMLRGETLTTLVSQSAIFDERFSAMVKVGEEVNQLERVFKHLSDQYAEQIQRRTKTLSTFIEPIMIAFLGVLVGTILVAMYLPLFEMNSSF